MELFIRVFEIVFPIYVIVALGVYCGKRFNPDIKSANQLNMDIFIPALIFSVLIGQSVDVRDYIPMIAAAAAIVLGSGLLAWPICYYFSFKIKTLVPACMFNNAGNIGIPLAVLTFGEQALPVAMILFLVENTLHFTVGMALLNKKHSWWRAMISPLTITTLVAIIMGILGITLPTILMLPIGMLGDIAIPLMLFSLGVRMSATQLKTLPLGFIGAIACPMTGFAMVLLVMPFVELSRQDTGILFLFSVLPPAILNYLFAERYKQEPDKVASIVITGNALGFVTLPLMLSYVLPRFVE